MDNAGKAVNERSVVVVLFFVGGSEVNAKIGRVTYGRSDAVPLGANVRHGQYWLALLGPKPKLAERPLERLRGPLEDEELRRICGGDPANADLSDWGFQFALGLDEASLDG